MLNDVLCICDQARVKILEQILSKGSFGQFILNLVIKNGKKMTKADMIKELQIHPVSGKIVEISHPPHFTYFFSQKLSSPTQTHEKTGLFDLII